MVEGSLDKLLPPAGPGFVRVLRRTVVANPRESQDGTGSTQGRFTLRIRWDVDWVGRIGAAHSDKFGFRGSA